MIIGVCAGAFPNVREYIATALPEAEIVVLAEDAAAEGTAAADTVPPRYFTSGNLAAAVRGAHALVVAVPLTGQTRGLVGATELAAMPPGGYLVNVGRGPVVDYQALRDALREGHLAGAGLDVTWSEPIDPEDDLLKENVIVTPHVAGVTRESYAKMAAAFAESVKELIRG